MREEDPTFEPVSEDVNLVSFHWWRSEKAKGRSSSVWTPWFWYYLWKMNLYNVHATGQGGTTLASHWRETGVHFGPQFSVTGECSAPL